jgi:hypothetical protein
MRRNGDSQRKGTAVEKMRKGGRGRRPEHFVVPLGLADLREEALEELVLVGLRRPHGGGGGVKPSRRRRGEVGAAFGGKTGETTACSVCVTCVARRGWNGGFRFVVLPRFQVPASRTPAVRRRVTEGGFGRVGRVFCGL